MVVTEYRGIGGVQAIGHEATSLVLRACIDEFNAESDCLAA